MSDENNSFDFFFFLHKVCLKTPPLHNVQTLHHTLVAFLNIKVILSAYLRLHSTIIKEGTS